MFDLVSGGLTGLAGTIWTSYNQRKEKELDLKREENKQKHILEMVRAESEHMLAEAQVNLHTNGPAVRGVADPTEENFFSESPYNDEPQSLSEKLTEKLAATKGRARFVSIPILSILCFVLGLADAVKYLARPCITIYLLAVSTWISYEAWMLLGLTSTPLSADQAVVIVDQTTSVLLYLSTTSVTWWFGDKMTEKRVSPPSKSKK